MSKSIEMCHCLNLVKLRHDMLPPGLHTNNTNGNPGCRASQFHHWPAFVYNNLTDLLSDLSPSELKQYKNKLMMENSKCRIKVVACLLAWDSRSSCGGSTKAVPGSLYFERGNLDILRLSGGSLDDNKSSGCDESIVDLFDNIDDWHYATNALISKYENASNESEGGMIYKHALQFNKALEVALNWDCPENGHDVKTEVANGVEGDSFSAPVQSRFHLPEEPKLGHRKRNGGLSKDSRNKRSKAMEKEGGSRLAVNKASINSSDRNRRTCLLDAISALLPSDEKKKGVCFAVASAMPPGGDTPIMSVNIALKAHDLILELVSNQYHKKGGAAFHLLQECQCKLIVNIKLTNNKKQIMSHFVAWDGKTVHDRPYMSVVNNEYDRAHQEGSKKVFGKLYKKSEFHSWQITSIYRLV